MPKVTVRRIARAIPAGFLLCFAPARVAAQPIASWQKQADAVTFSMPPGRLRVQVCTARILRVTYSPMGAFPTTRSLAVNARFAPTPWHLTATPQEVVVWTDLVQARVNRATGAVRFTDAKGASLLAEMPNGRAMTPTTLAGPTPEAAYQSQQSFALPADEGIYGLGQHQAGDMNYQGRVVRLEQQNREVAIPLTRMKATM